MKYVAKCSIEDGGYLSASRALAELRTARRELQAARRRLRMAS